MAIVFILTTLVSGNTSAQDEFQSFDSQAEIMQAPKDSAEFESFEEFGSFVETDSLSSAHLVCNGEKGCCNKGKNENLTWVIGILIVTVIAGFFVRFRRTRNLRGLFLIGSVVILGFYKGACPCPISSMQNLVLAGLGVDVEWQSLIWFLALIPVTYLFGRVYCGWICHLGALQEFIFLPAKIKMLQGLKAQKIMRIIRIVFLVALIIQLFVSKSILFKHYDPSMKSAGSMLLDERVLGISAKKEWNSVGLSLQGGTVYDNIARMQDVCGTRHIYNLLRGSKVNFVGDRIFDSNFLLAEFNWNPGNRTIKNDTTTDEFAPFGSSGEFSEFSGKARKTKIISLKNLGFRAYEEYGIVFPSYKFYTGSNLQLEIFNSIQLDAETIFQLMKT